MPYPQGRGVYIDKHLTNLALNYRPTGFIADNIFPMVRVPKQSGVIKTYNQADLLRREDTKRSPASPANMMSFQVSSDSYYAQNYALKMATAVEDRANADPIFIMDLEGGRAMRIMDSLLLDWEVRIANQVTTVANVGTASATASAWTDYTNSDPLGEVWTMIDNLKGATAYRPNKIVFGENAWDSFHRNDAVIDKVQGTGVTGGGRNATQRQVAELLEMDEVLVGRSYYNTAEEGQAQSLSSVWADNVLIYYSPLRPTVEAPAFGYSFRWVGNGLANMQVERHPYDRIIKADQIEIGYYQDEKITSSALAGLIVGTDTSSA